jgi:hypothetical protein
MHAAANVAATVSSKGSVELWGLTPLQRLPVHLQQQQQHGLPQSWRQCTSCCWLTFGGASAAAAAAAAGMPGLPLLLAVHGGDGVDVCLVVLSGLPTQQQQQQEDSSTAAIHPQRLRGQQQQQQQQNGYHSQLGWGSNNAAAAAAAAAAISEVHVSSVQVLTQLALPAGISLLKQLAEVSAAPVQPAAAAVGVAASDQQQQQQVVLQAVLLGLGSSGEVPNDSQQQQQLLSRVSDAAAVSDEGGGDAGQDVWVSWTLNLTPTPTAAAADAGKLAAAAAAAALDGWQLSASLAQQTSAADAISAAVAAGICSDWPSKQQQQRGALTSVDSVNNADSAAESDDRAEQLSAAISCLQCPSPASPFVVTGDASGLLMFWQVVSGTAAAAAAAANADDDSTICNAAAADSQQQQQQVETAGPGLQLVQASCCDVGGVDFGGIVVAVALCTSAGYAAAAITCGQVSVC